MLVNGPHGNPCCRGLGWFSIHSSPVFLVSFEMGVRYSWEECQVFFKPLMATPPILRSVMRYVLVLFVLLNVLYVLDIFFRLGIFSFCWKSLHNNIFAFFCITAVLRKITKIFRIKFIFLIYCSNRYSDCKVCCIVWNFKKINECSIAC